MPTRHTAAPRRDIAGIYVEANARNSHIALNADGSARRRQDCGWPGACRDWTGTWEWLREGRIRVDSHLRRGFGISPGWTPKPEEIFGIAMVEVFDVSPETLVLVKHDGRHIEQGIGFGEFRRWHGTPRTSGKSRLPAWRAYTANLGLPSPFGGLLNALRATRLGDAQNDLLTIPLSYPSEVP